MQRFYGEKRDEYGRAEAGASVSVYDTGTSNLSVIYAASDPLTTPSSAIPNPLTTDANGLYGFAAPTGVYDIVIHGSGAAEYKNKVAMFDQTTSSTTGAGGSNTQVQYNNGGVLTGSSALTTDGTNLTVGGYESVEAVRFNTSTPDTSNVTGNTYWDSANKTLTTVIDSTLGINLQHGQEQYVHCINDDAVKILNGKVVYINGSYLGEPTVVLAKANTLADSWRTIGIATQDIEVGAIGLITTFGLVHDLDTSGYYADGVPLFLSATTAGDLTDAAPSSPNYVVQVGLVVGKGVAGAIFVSPSRIVANDDSLTDNSKIVAPSQRAVKAYSDAFASSLASTASAALGDTLIGVEQPFTGAVPTTQHEFNSRTVSLMDWAKGNSNINSGGGADDTDAINTAIAYAKASGSVLSSPAGKCFRITSPVTFFGVLGLDLRGEIYADGVTASPAVIIGGHSTGSGYGRFYVNRVHDGGDVFDAPTKPLIQVFGLKDSIVEIDLCRFVELYADSATVGGTSIAYNTFNLGFVYKLQLRGATNTSWINQNQFNGGRLSFLNVGTTTTEYGHNFNIWNFPTFEGAIQINFNVGSMNQIQNCRFEGADVVGSQITFSEVASQNIITNGYDTSATGSQFFDPAFPVSRLTDLGANNVVSRTMPIYHSKVIVFDLDARTPYVINGVPTANTSYSTTDQRGLFDRNLVPLVGAPGAILPGLDWIAFTGSFRDIFESEFIPCTVGSAFAVEFHTSVSLCRYAIRVYDSNFTLLGAEGIGGAYIAGSNITYNSGNYSVGANLPSGTYGFSVSRTEVKYIKIYLYTGNAGGNLRSAACYYAEPITRTLPQVVASEKSYRAMTLASIPTGGYVTRGTMVVKEDGTSVYICTFSYETTTNGALAGGATSVTVTTIGTVANADVVGILLDDGTTHWGAVATLAGSTFTVAALPSPAASGNRIVFNRWATK